ncbi:hypothetical protein CRG98_016575 [Punica granatum]|uniref:Extensin-like n=1 Tax=Punica granatum TaxID=22663 RepID=A0A2I0K3C5_PUNGR|nr:hypothetical protein CRG98_016575 [Punica granatum]
MDRPAPGLRLEAITPPRQDIMRIWRTLRPVDHAYIQGIIRDMVMFTETPVDWIFLRIAMEFWDPEHAVFNFQGTELTPTIEEYTALIQRPTSTTQGIFVPNPFATIRSQLSSLLGITTQDIHEELHQGWDHGIRIADQHHHNGPRPPRLLELHLPPLPKPKAPSKRPCARSYGPSGRNEIGSVASLLIPAQRSPTTESFRRSVLPAYSGALPTHLPPPTSSGAPPPPPQLASLTSPASDDQARIAALEGTVNQMATNMVELLALLRGPNRASSSSTPPPGQGPTADPTPWVLPTQAPENMEVPVPPTLHTSMAHPFTDPFPPAPTAVPLPPTAFLSSDQVLSAPPPVSMQAPSAIYAAPPPTVFQAPSALAPTRPQVAELPSYPPLQPHTSFPYQAPPPINTAFHEPGTPTHAAQFASPTHFFPEADTEQERRLKRMEETIRALQANDTRPDARYGDCSLFPGMRLPPKFKAGKKLDLGIKLGRMEDPASKGEESPKKVPVTSSSSGGRRGKEVSVNAVNTAHQAPQQYSVNFTSAPPVAPSYAPHAPQYRPQPPTQPIYYSALPPPPPSTVPSPVIHHYALLHPRPLNTNPQLRGLPSRHNEPRPRKVNRAEQHNRDPAGNTRPCRSHFPTFTGKFVTRSGQQRPARALIQPSKIRASNASTIEGHQGTP